MDEAFAAFGFGKQDGVRLARHDCREIGVGLAGLEPVDAHQQARALRFRLRALEVFEAGGARMRFALRRNRIFQIDDDGVGAGRNRLVELGTGIGRDEEERAHGVVSSYFGRLVMKALRWHSATSLPSCLNAL